MELNAFLFANGMSAVYNHYGHQVTELQESWFLLFVSHLEAHGIDPQQVKFHMPQGLTVRVTKTEDGYNYSS